MVTKRNISVDLDNDPGTDEPVMGDAQPEPRDQGTSPEPSERPEWLPEKFDTPQAMAEAYRNLEQRLGQPRQEQDQPEPETPAPTQEEPGSLDIPEPQEEEAGNIWETARNEFNTNGEIGEGTLKTLRETMKVPENMVRDFIEGQKARGREVARQLFQAVGGAQEYQNLVRWAADNLPAKQREAFNRSLRTGDADEALVAVEALQARRARANGREPQLQTGTGSGNRSVQAYRSKQEAMDAMNDPRYATDSEYRKQVAMRIPDNFNQLD